MRNPSRLAVSNYRYYTYPTAHPRQDSATNQVITSPAIGKPAKKAAGSSSRPQRMTARTTQVTPSYRYQQNMSSRMGGARYHGGTRYSGTRSYAGRPVRRNRLLQRHTAIPR